MEKSLSLTTPDNHKIYYIHNSQKASDKLIIFVHGLTGEPNEHYFHNGAKFFPAHGFHTIRIALYSPETNARKLETTSLKDNINDIDLIIEKYKDKYKNIFLTGHSLGAFACVFCKNLNLIKKLVLWDISIDLMGLRQKYTYDENRKYYFKLSEYYKPLSEKVYNEIPKFNLIKRLTDMQTPTLGIFAGKSKNAPHLPLIYSIKNGHFTTALIKDATHCFDEEGAEDELLKITLDYLN